MKRKDINILKSIGFKRMDKSVYALGGYCVSKFCDTLDLADASGEIIFYDKSAYAIVGYMLVNGLIKSEFILKQKP